MPGRDRSKIFGCLADVTVVAQKLTLRYFGFEFGTLGVPTT